ncbi:hypothetical protein VOLCADRAFT_95285 [Volvox carteri f. nagariensis]|uniref:Uncharacterized protein n=1 Tax=Volvox carteri f. nagariensis TaxID=3068 RepID=D8U733_VOLCA|nr:uncharacterized protein VOLCADRAFT_95285 [Volvox carteri f. nagariensis]EFJ44359.1 hypothetical protein VOLCADRAFT_95285 [Volvox carteri f. nagariensis]|eukprot:XP_002954466.1 hypothetical protein VOLCADRAFT_95285 [Volvox carteri f. nagariensis]
MAGVTGAYGCRDQGHERQPSQKRQRLEALVELGFKADLANLLVYGLELDPNEASDAAIAHQLLDNGLKDFTTVKAVTGGHFSWLPKLVASVRLCPFIILQPERLRVLDSKEAVTVSAVAAAILGTTDHDTAGAGVVGKVTGMVQLEDDLGIDDSEQPQ